MEQVNHPSHYKKEGRKECIEEMIELYGRNATAIFCLTNAYKYLYRAGEKENNSEQQDVEKARWYFNYVNKHLSSCVRYKGVLRLYNDIKRALKDYD